MAHKKSSLQRLFPDTKTAAYYNPLSQIINLCKYEKTDFDTKALTNLDSGNIEKISLLEHELTHWLDHISTLWGQQNLVLIYNALNARASGNIDEFWRIKHLFTSFNANDFFDYFTEEYNHPETRPKSPWKYGISCGIRFSNEGKPEYNKPILFLRFNCFDDIPLIRVPVSVASILECNAINYEFDLKINSAHEIKDVVEKNMKLSDIKSELLSILYDKDFALYTAIAHLTANLNNQSDAIWTYKTASSIGTTVLNLPDSIYETMDLVKINDTEWDRRIVEFKNIRDKGFCFYNLLKNLVDKNGKNNYSIESLLKSSNLPTKSELEDLIINEMQKNLSLLVDGPFKNLASETILNGIEIFKMRGIDGGNKNFRERFLAMKILPKLIFGDTYFDDTSFDILHTIEKLQNGQSLSTDEIYLTSSFYEKKFSEFLNACGV